MINNLDQSTSGINIEAIVEFDYGLGQHFFAEYISKVEGKYIYTSYGSLSNDPIEFTPLPRQKGKLLKAMLEDEHEFLEYYTKAELKDMTQDMLIEVLGEILYDDEEIQDFYNENDVNTTKETDYCEIYTTGYSQGDCATVWVNVKEFEDVLGAKFDEAEMKKYIHGLFWDSPQFVRATINDKEYTDSNSHNCYGRFGNYEHNYDKDRFIVELLEATKDENFDAEVLKTELEELLPDEVKHPAYS